MLTRLSGLLAAGGLVGAVAIGCSSTSPPASSPDDGGLVHPDSGVGHLGKDVDASPATPMDDGTTGKLCHSDTECQTVAGTNRCSNDYTVRITNVPVKIWGTGVCIKALPTAAGQGGNCDPTDAVNDPLGQFIHFCDGADDPSSPGICIPFDVAAPQPGQGICYPKCTFKNDGTAATGCAGHNACGLITYFMDPMTSVVTGYGFCQGACSTDSDCADLPAAPDAGAYHCQTDLGYCTTTPIAMRTKNIGDACTHVGTVNDSTRGACNCAFGSAMLGFCTSVCTVGGAPCPNGWACDSGEPASLSFQMGAKMVSVTKPNVGMLGTCTPLCTPADAAAPAPVSDANVPADGSAAAEAGPPPAAGGCPANSSCMAGAVVGADCQP